VPGCGWHAGHIRFGVHTGGALIILGLLLLLLAMFFADSIATLFRLFPAPVLGVILFFGGLELASPVGGEGTRADNIVQVVTAGVVRWNPGVAYLGGLLLHHADRRGLIRLADPA
jgi:Molybdate transporter of MFS superfamily